MLELQESSPKLEEPSCPPPNTDIFNKATAPIQYVEETQQILGHLKEELAQDDTQRPRAELKKMLRGVKAAKKLLEEDIQSTLEQKLLDCDLAQFKSYVSTFSISGAPQIGEQFVAAIDKSECVTKLASLADGLSAVFVAYTYPFGPANEVHLDTDSVDESENKFGSRVKHEYFHVLQMKSAPVLEHAPLNPNTRVLLHPLRWAQVQDLCEGNASTLQGLFDYIENMNDPEQRLRAATKSEVISVDDFERYLNNSHSLENALVNTNLNALDKPYRENGDSSYTFRDYYHGVSLDIFDIGVKMRKDNGEDIIYIDLEDEDLHAIGASKVGPNSLGEDHIDPGFLKTPNFRGKNETKYAEIIKKYDIPPLEQCMTYTEYRKQQESKNSPEGNVAPFYSRGHFETSQTVHAPAYA